MARFLKTILGCLGVGLVVLGACTEETTINNYYAGTQASVIGRVEMWNCGVGDFSNNFPDDSRLFDEVTAGDSCRVVFTRLNGNQYALATGDSGAFEVVLDRGPYTVEVESRWSVPETIGNVYIDNDTTLELGIVRFVSHPDTVGVAFLYDSSGSMGAEWEWEKIRLLNGSLGNRLQLSGITVPDSMLDRRKESDFGGVSGVYWKILIGSDDTIWELYHDARDHTEQLSSDTARIYISVPATTCRSN